MNTNNKYQSGYITSIATVTSDPTMEQHPLSRDVQIVNFDVIENFNGYQLISHARMIGYNAAAESAKNDMAKYRRVKIAYNVIEDSFGERAIHIFNYSPCEQVKENNSDFYRKSALNFNAVNAVNV